MSEAVMVDFSVAPSLSLHHMMRYEKNKMLGCTRQVIQRFPNTE